MRPGKAEPALPAWDIVVRSSHWLVAAAILSNGLINKPGGTVHVWLGWIVMVVLLARFVWGLVGSAEARFSAFPPRPRAAISHLKKLLQRDVEPHRSHNPAGAMMIWALWGGLGVVILTGLAITGWQTPMAIAAQKAAVANGDWSAMVAASRGAVVMSRETRHLIAEVHGVAANMILVLAAIHIGGVAAESWAMRRNLLAPMLISRRKGPGV